MRLIHITDPHLTPLDGVVPDSPKRALSWLSWQTRRRARHLRSRLDALVRQLGPDKPDCWALGGDLCQIGTAAEVRAAGDWLRRLDRPDRIVLVPGNHDIFGRGSAEAVLQQWSPWLHVDPQRPEWPVVREFGDVRVIALNSAVVTPILLARGAVGQAQRERLAAALQAGDGNCRAVLIHHPPQPGACKPRKALADAAALTEVLRAHGAAFVLHGHVHRNRTGAIPAIAGAEGSEIPVFATASPSAAGPLGAASARIFDIESSRDGYSITMRLVALDAGNRLHPIERLQWISDG
ncbi:MAG: metallophosphoesterase [Wenzhouxiangellaceae bacterium]|nr:metallophosphoesterase [Wenzhouxiangellaceae bacterium]